VALARFGGPAPQLSQFGDWTDRVSPSYFFGPVGKSWGSLGMTVSDALPPLQLG
jgi:hypothetical protein